MASALVVIILVAGLGSAMAGQPADPPAPSASKGAGPGGAVTAPADAKRNLDTMLELLAKAPDPASAAAARERVLALWDVSGSATADLLEVRAGQALAAHDTSLALDLLDAAIVVAPQWPGGRHGRAAVHLLRNETWPAIADLQAVLALEPRHFPALTMLSMVMEQIDRKREALELLRRAVAIDPQAEGLSARLKDLTIEVEGREL